MLALNEAIGNSSSIYINDAETYIKEAASLFTRANIVFEGCDDTASCRGDQIAFRGMI